MRIEPTESHQRHLDFVRSNFKHLRRSAIEDLTHYTSRWAVYTIDFLNSVAKIQGSDLRLDPGVVALVRNSARHRICEPRVEKLLDEARDARSLKINELIGLIAAECSKIEQRQRVDDILGAHGR